MNAQSGATDRPIVPARRGQRLRVNPAAQSLREYATNWPPHMRPVLLGAMAEVPHDATWAALGRKIAEEHETNRVRGAGR